MSDVDSMLPGVRVEPGGSVSFLLWAPRADAVDLHLVDEKLVVPMERGERGYFSVRTDATRAGMRYLYRTAAGEFPDPASRSQPEGVHAASQVVDFSTVRWTDDEFEPPAPSQLIVYEVHVGTFTPDGTFAAAAERLPRLAELGVTAVEVMPIAEFAGRRNWGYDGVYLYAAESSYGGPLEFARFVNAAHAAGLAVILDVVFNHFGPEGNYSGQFGDYVTDRYLTPWGDAINVDRAGSDAVRAFFFGCLEHWMENCHVDGFRLDAIHEIHDESAVPFLSELTERVAEFGRKNGRRRIVIAESDLNDRRVVEPRDAGGRGMAAAWTDDFHHAVHAHLTGERNGYYADFGGLEHIARALEHGWCYSWDYSVARRRHHGNDPSGLPTRSFVFCTQNHDQVGNRMMGERLRTLVGPAADRVAQAVLLLSPYVPLLFMGQEYGEERPFLYFVDHTDPGLLGATREGRAREFAAFHQNGTPPDPGSPDTLRRSVLDWPENTDSDEYRYTRDLLELRSRYDCFRPAGEGQPEVTRSAFATDQCLLVSLRGRESAAIVIANLCDGSCSMIPSQAVSSRTSGARRNGATALPSTAEVVFSLESELKPGGRLRPVDELHLQPYALVALVWPVRRTPSQL